MPTRRQTLALTLPLAAGVALTTRGAVAQTATAARPNPMPAALRTALERDPTAPVLGNPKGDITLSEFFDYNCPYCKTVMPMMQRLIAADPGLRVVFREWPVFGEGSDFAARAALAALRHAAPALSVTLSEALEELAQLRRHAAAAQALVVRGVVGKDQFQPPLGLVEDRAHGGFQMRGAAEIGHDDRNEGPGRVRGSHAGVSRRLHHM